MRVLGIETSCDETSVALLEHTENQLKLEAHLVASQLEHHRPYGGVVPEVATRQHLKQLDPMVDRILKSQGRSLEDVDLIAVTQGPGLASSLMVGFCYAQGLALASSISVLGINHMEGHLFSPFLSHNCAPVFPHLSLIVSGGHTMLVYVKEPWNYKIIGRTRDDAVGEAFDKVAKLLGLAYPGGPEVEKRAQMGDDQRYAFPRSMLHSGDYAFSLSGLKTSVRYALQKQDKVTASTINDFCASFQKAVIDVLVGKTEKAIHSLGVKTLTLSGGVSCNRTLADALERMCRQSDVRFLGTIPEFSTDNAAMIAYAAALRERDQVSSMNKGLDIDPNWQLDACSAL
ncbi:MAG: tRNA (adenosine(37)-N6)-threonylcarbamoyltransferase complex transferase subunit TsaD [Verrucomicrobiota bacterium]